MVCVSAQGWMPRSKHRLAEYVSCLSVCSSDIYESFLAVLYVLFLIKLASWSQLACSVQILETENLLSVALAFQISILRVSKDTETDCVLLKEELKTLSSFSHPHVIPNCMTFFCETQGFCIISELFFSIQALMRVEILLQQSTTIACSTSESLGFCVK